MNTPNVECPGCKVILPGQRLGMEEHYNASGECYQLYGELSAYTLEKGDLTFIHQLAVDAYGAQHAGSTTKPIRAVFSLVGLCLVSEHQFTGRAVQLAHMKLAKQPVDWPQLEPPSEIAELNVQSVWMAREGDERDEMIKRWAEEVWKTWKHQHDWIRDICRKLI